LFKRIIAIILTAILLVTFSGCTEYVNDFLNEFFQSLVITENSNYEPENSNKVNSLKIDKTQLDEDVKLSEYYSSIALKNGFNTLDSESQKKCYLSIIENSENFKADDGKYTSGTFVVYDCQIEERELAKIFDAVLQDNPQLFWLDVSYSYAIYSDYVTLDLHYTMSQTEQIKKKKQLNAVVNDILAGLEKNMSEFELELHLHDYLIKNCVYDKKAAKKMQGNAFNVYGALVQQKAVCQGYTDAFQLLLSYVGINSYKISGVSEDTNHVWNVVNIENKDYFVDVTWDDTKDYCMYDYFNITSEQLSHTHTIKPLYEDCSEEQLVGDKIISFNILSPDCKAKKYNYYAYKGCRLSDNQYSNISDYIIEKANNNEKIIHLYVDTEKLDFNNVYDDLFGESYGFSQYISQANYNLTDKTLSNQVYVSKKEKLSTITVELKYE